MGVDLSVTELNEIWQRLDGLGMLAPRQPGDHTRRLTNAARESMLATLSFGRGGLASLRAALLQVGMTQAHQDFTYALAEHPSEDTDWALLEQLVYLYPSEFEGDPFANALGIDLVPRSERQAHPIFSVVVATAQATDPVSGDFDVGLMVSVLLRDARELHAGWRSHTNIDAQLVAGSLWMIAQSSAGVSASSFGGEDESWQTHLELEQLIREASRDSCLPSATPLALFHTLAAVVAGLRADWAEVSRHAEPALLLSAECGLLGFVASCMLAIASFFSGIPNGRRRAERFLARHEGHQCRASVWMASVSRLPRTLWAIADLDRAEAEARIDELRSFAPSHWFDDSLVLYMAVACAGILWANPEHALASFDAAASKALYQRPKQDRIRLLSTRWRIELLLNLGDLSQAGDLIDELRSSSEPHLAVVPLARLHLCRADFSGALAAADKQLHSAELSLHDRASLQVIKAAAGLLGGSHPDMVERATAAACLLCAEARSLIPFGFIPHQVLAELLERHLKFHDGRPCQLRRTLDPVRLARLNPSYPTITASVQLTGREKSLLPLLATRATLGDIAAELFISVNTVRKQVTTLREKFGANDRRELIIRATELGFLDSTGGLSQPSTLS